ncbi:MAG: Coq4 family protein [Pseudomonadota bacterium]
MKFQHDFAAGQGGTAAEPPVVHPDRPVPRFRPLKALHHFRELLKDKEDTEQVFHIFECLPRKNFRSDAKAFTLSETGRAVRAQEPSLPDLLDDHDRLRAMPEGSLAHAYCDFMEQEGLTAAGLVAESDKFQQKSYGDLIEWYGYRQRDTHDLLHVLTGYGRDALGEQCVLAFTYGQSPALGHLFIAYGGGLNLKQTVKSKAPIFKAIREAQKMGRACPKITDRSITDLLARPLDEIRREFGIGTPEYYQQSHDIYRSEGIDPYDLLAEGEAKAA